MRKFKQAFLASVLASSMVVTPVFADDVSNLQNSKNAAQSEVNSLQSELQTLIEKMSKLEDDLVSTGQQITQAQDDLTVAKEKEHQQYEDMKKRIKYMYEEGNSTAIETLISAENFSDLLNKAEYVQNVHSYDRKQLQEYIDTKQQIADLKAQLEEDQANLESMQSDYEAEQTTLSNTLESKKEEVADLDQQLQAAVAAGFHGAAHHVAPGDAQIQAVEHQYKGAHDQGDMGVQLQNQDAAHQYQDGRYHHQQRGKKFRLLLCSLRLFHCCSSVPFISPGCLLFLQPVPHCPSPHRIPRVSSWCRWPQCPRPPARSWCPESRPGAGPSAPASWPCRSCSQWSWPGTVPARSRTERPRPSKRPSGTTDTPDPCSCTP